MNLFRNLFLVMIFLVTTNVNAQRFNQKLEAINNYTIKFSNYASDYLSRSATLLQYRLTDQSNTLNELGKIAGQYADYLSHIADLIQIHEMSKEENVKEFSEKRIDDLKSLILDHIHNPNIDVVDALIQSIEVQSMKEKTKELRKDLILIGSFLQLL